MFMLNAFKRRVLGSLSVASVAAVMLLSLSGAAAAQPVPPVSEWPVLDMASPSPGALLSNGDYVVSGMAYDPAATQGSGIGRVDLFLGDRDQGGMFLGSAVPGQNAFPAAPGSTLAENGFQLTVTLPSSVTGGKEFYAYAYSSLTGNMTCVSMPVNIAVAPTSVPAGTPVALPVAEIDHMRSAAGPTETFSLANPSAGDVISNGDYIVSGAVGSSIDRVQLFLDDRDTGGAILGTAIPENGTFSAKVTIPSAAAGSHTFVAYAQSTATGLETKISTSIYVGAAPTPTPRPASTSGSAED